MILFPAIDLKGGKAVRLEQGKKEKTSIYDDNPVKKALHWQSLGAKWLHVIDLDGAFAEASKNREIIGEIAAQTDIPIQTGGGIRTLGDCEELLEKGVERLIIGTVALENPELFHKMCKNFPCKIGVSLDAANGFLKSRGWLKTTEVSIEKIIPELEDAGASFFIYTDITRDGMHTGLNLTALNQVLQIAAIPVIAAGGVSTLVDIQNAYALSANGNLQGVVCGKSIYDGTLDFQSAQKWLDCQNNHIF